MLLLEPAFTVVCHWLHRRRHRHRYRNSADEFWIGGRFHSLGACQNSRPKLGQMAQAARLWQEHLTGFAVELSVTPAFRGIRIAAPETPEGLTIAEAGLRYLFAQDLHVAERPGRRGDARNPRRPGMMDGPPTDQTTPPSTPLMPRVLSDQRFLTIRSLVVELSAALDRVERHAAEESIDLDEDIRWRLLAEAVTRLAAGPGRVESVQELFSDAYDPAWRQTGGPELSGSPGCCGS